MIEVHGVARVGQGQPQSLSVLQVHRDAPGRVAAAHHAAVEQLYAVAVDLKDHAAPVPHLIVDPDVGREDGAGPTQVIVQPGGKGGRGVHPQPPGKDLPADGQRLAVELGLLAVAAVKFHRTPAIGGRDIRQLRQHDVARGLRGHAVHRRLAPVGVIVEVVVAAVTDQETQFPDPGHAHVHRQAQVAAAPHAAVEQHLAVTEDTELRAAQFTHLFIDAHKGAEGVALPAQRVPDLGRGVDAQALGKAAPADFERGAVTDVLLAVAAVPLDRSPATCGRGPVQV
ncbi:hypothetical protein DEMA109039_22530 [Deinococcus marmoris]